MATALRLIEQPATAPTAGPAAVDAAPIRLEIFDTVPPWAIVHAASNDRTAPLIRKGEVAVIESDGRKGWIPEDGGLYLIEYVCPPPSPHYGYERRIREIVQTCKNERGDWWAHPYARTWGGRRMFVCSDGPYRNECTLGEKLLGRVIGLYRPFKAFCDN